MRKHLRHQGVISVVLLLFVSACSNTSQSDVRTINVSMNEFSFDPHMIKVEAGETIRFIITNDGVIKHEFEVSTQHEIDEHMTDGHEGNHDDEHESGEAEEFEITLGAGETGELVVTFGEAQELFFVCLLPGHYEAGMVGEFDFGMNNQGDDH